MDDSEDTSLICEFLGGPFDGRLARILPDVECFVSIEADIVSFGDAVGFDRFCRVYTPDGDGHLVHTRHPRERFPATEDVLEGD